MERAPHPLAPLSGVGSATTSRPPAGCRRPAHGAPIILRSYLPGLVLSTAVVVAAFAFYSVVVGDGSAGTPLIGGSADTRPLQLAAVPPPAASDDDGGRPAGGGPAVPLAGVLGVGGFPVLAADAPAAPALRPEEATALRLRLRGAAGTLRRRGPRAARGGSEPVTAEPPAPGGGSRPAPGTVRPAPVVRTPRPSAGARPGGGPAPAQPARPAAAPAKPAKPHPVPQGPKQKPKPAPPQRPAPAPKPAPAPPAAAAPPAPAAGEGCAAGNGAGHGYGRC